MSDEELKAMVDAFLAWPLPNDVAADAIACQPGALHRTGTNLLTAAQTRAMFEHCLAVVREHDGRDAERMKWLADYMVEIEYEPTPEETVCIWLLMNKELRRECYETSDLRAAIDAAMRGEG